MANGYYNLEAQEGFTDQEREAWESDLNGEYDRFDGWDDIDDAQEIAYDDCIGCAADYRFEDDLDDYVEIDENGVAFDDYPDEDDDILF